MASASACSVWDDTSRAISDAENIELRRDADRRETLGLSLAVATGDVNGDGFAGSIQARPTEFCLWSDRPNGVGGFRLYVSVRQ